MTNNKVARNCEELSLKRQEVLSCKEYRNAYIMPWIETNDSMASGGVVSSEGVFVQNSTNEDAHLCKGYDWDDIPFVEDVVIYLGNFIPVWGHAITDMLKKIWYVYTETCTLLEKQGAKLVYITQFGKELPAYCKRLLELAGVDVSRLIRITEVTRFSKVVVPDHSIVSLNDVRSYHEEYKKTIDKIINTIHIDQTLCFEKVYFTRTQLTSNRDIGEQDLENVFRKEGFVVISPEKYSIEQQISILQQCKEFASTEGSVSHSVVFCRPETKVVILKKSDFPNYYQLMANDVAQVNAFFLKAHHSVRNNPNEPWAGPFYLCITRDLEKYLGHRIIRVPRLIKPSWLWYYYGIYPWAHKVNALLHWPFFIFHKLTRR